MRVLASTLAIGVALVFTLSTVAARSGPATVGYIEVNDDALGNAGRYTLTDGSNVFDIAIIFAANINYNGTAAVLYNNPQVQAVLDNATTQIRPLQAKGIKVVLSILGNHQGAGIANFATQKAAANFAAQVRATIERYDLDGVDLDDEYADYGTNGTAQPNAHSIGWLLTALRADMPRKLITFYNIGPAAQSLAAANASIGAKLNYAWNPDYDSYDAPQIPGLTNKSLSAAAVNIQSTPAGDANSFALQTVADGYGAYMTYGLDAGNHSAYVSKFTRPLYGLGATYQ